MKKEWKIGEQFESGTGLYIVTGFDGNGDRISKRLGLIEDLVKINEPAQTISDDLSEEKKEELAEKERIAKEKAAIARKARDAKKKATKK